MTSPDSCTDLCIHTAHAAGQQRCELCLLEGTGGLPEENSLLPLLATLIIIQSVLFQCSTGMGPTSASLLQLPA